MQQQQFNLRLNNSGLRHDENKTVELVQLSLHLICHFFVGPAKNPTI